MRVGVVQVHLVNDILYRVLMQRVYKSKTVPGRHTRVEGDEYLDKVINIDQSPIGRTPRSNPATYTGVFDAIRKLFSQTQEAKVRGYMPGRFSFNVKGGRCEACAGDGTIKIEMHFLPDVYVPCEVCRELSYNRDTLDITFKGKKIAEVLDISRGGVGVFQTSGNRPAPARWSTWHGIVRWGRPRPTFRRRDKRVKLRRSGQELHGHTIYILESHTGLHVETSATSDRAARLGEQGNRCRHRAQLGVIRRPTGYRARAEGLRRGTVGSRTPDTVAKTPQPPALLAHCWGRERASGVAPAHTLLRRRGLGAEATPARRGDGGEARWSTPSSNWPTRSCSTR